MITFHNKHFLDKHNPGGCPGPSEGEPPAADGAVDGRRESELSLH